MKESWEYSISERERVIESSTIIDTHKFRGKDNGVEIYDLDCPYRTIIHEASIAGSKDAYDNFFNAIKKGYFTIVRDGESLFIEAKPLPRNFFGDHLIHVMSYENYQILDQDSYIGDNKKVGMVYVQTPEMLVLPNEDTFKEGTHLAKLIVDTDSLFLRNRKLFIDEETISETPEEFEKSFLMYGGIPASCITEVQIIKVGKIENQQDEKNTLERANYQQIEKGYNRRLESVRAKLKNLIS